jgi:hypothetical protein
VQFERLIVTIMGINLGGAKEHFLLYKKKQILAN